MQRRPASHAMDDAYHRSDRSIECVQASCFIPLDAAVICVSEDDDGGARPSTAASATHAPV